MSRNRWRIDQQARPSCRARVAAALLASATTTLLRAARNSASAPTELLVPVEGQAPRSGNDSVVFVMEREHEQDRDRQIEQREQDARNRAGRYRGPPRRVRRPGCVRSRATALTPQNRPHVDHAAATATSTIVATSMIIENAEPSGQFAAFVKKSWMMLPYMMPLAAADEQRRDVLADRRDEHEEEGGERPRAC